MAENPILNERYRLIEQIGSGGMSVIYKAQDLELGRMVAVKVLRPSLVGDPEFLIRFKREAQAAANLSHPNIVTVHDVGQDGPKTHYIVMEYVTGQDLKRLIRSRGAFEVDAALAIVIEVCKGVGYAHRAGLVHCDVKPQNILVTPDNSIKVTDFGIARALSGQPSEVEDMVWGSPHYFSPEQAAGEPPTPASDVYSIGIVLFELLTDHLPFTGQDYHDLALAHLKAQPPSILDLNPVLPTELDRVIRKVLSKEPSARYRTADQLGRILEKYRQQGQQPTTAFIVKPSVVSPAPPEPPQEEMPSPQYQEHSFPPPEIGRQYAYETEQASTYENPYDDYSQDLVPGIDIYGLVLGVLAVVAVLGLIPLWLTVYLTLTR
ncbi:MAG: serine/threonine protein kinase [Anaerolineae bacterium]|nr:serine/threonine protein kinase [Anaerolineae bacterium]